MKGRSYFELLTFKTFFSGPVRLGFGTRWSDKLNDQSVADCSAVTIFVFSFVCLVLVSLIFYFYNDCSQLCLVLITPTICLVIADIFDLRFFD